MKKMRRSSVALIAVGAAILALGTALALTVPSDALQLGAGRGSRWGTFSQADRKQPLAFGMKGLMRRGMGLGLGLAPLICLVPAFLVGTGVGIVAGRRRKKGGE